METSQVPAYAQPELAFPVSGNIFTALGAVLMCILAANTITIGEVGFDINTLLYTSAMLMIGVNLILFNAFTRTYARVTGFIPMPENEKKKFLLLIKESLSERCCL